MGGVVLWGEAAVLLQLGWCSPLFSFSPTSTTSTFATITCSTLTACSTFTTYTIVTIATTTYTASIFTTTPRPPLTAHSSDSSLGGGGAPSWKRHGDLLEIA